MLDRLLLAAAFAAAVAGGCVSHAVAAPNFLLVVCDDCGMQEWQAPHPILDAIKAEGVTFTQARTGPLCSTTRAALYTGHEALRYGLTTALPNAITQPGGKGTGARVVPLDAELIGEVLQRQGYWTALVGKYHISTANDAHEQGFGLAYVYNHADGDRYLDSHRFRNGVDEGPVQHQATDNATQLERLLRQAVASGQPWLVAYTPHLIHGPMKPAGRYASQFPSTPEGKRAAMFEHFLESVRDALVSLPTEVRAETHVIVLSDNGASPSWRHGADPSHAGLRGFKRLLYDGGTRTHLIWSGPGVTARGALAAPVDVTDIPATIAALAGASFSAPIDGRSLVPLLQGAGSIPRLARNVVRASVNGPFALARVEEDAAGRPWKVVRERGGFELYDLIADPGEASDLCAAEVERCAAMQARLMSDLDERTRIAGVPEAWTVQPGQIQRLPDIAALSVGHGDIQFELSLSIDDGTAGGNILLKPGQWRVDVTPDLRLRVVVYDADPIGVPIVWDTAQALTPGVAYRLRFRHVGLPRGPGRVVAEIDGPGIAPERLDEATTDGVRYDTRPLSVGGYGASGSITGFRFWLLAWGEW